MRYKICKITDFVLKILQLYSYAIKLKGSIMLLCVKDSIFYEIILTKWRSYSTREPRGLIHKDKMAEICL